MLHSIAQPRILIIHSMFNPVLAEDGKRNRIISNDSEHKVWQLAENTFAVYSVL